MAEPIRIDAQNPWPWLDPFTEIASGFFHGRSDDVQALLRAVLATPACVLFGRSGLGKTSLLLAGLFALLRARNLLPAPLRRFEHAEGMAGLSANLLRALDEAIGQQPSLHWTGTATEEGSSGDDIAILWERLHDRQRLLIDDQKRRWTPVFVLDQFEEIFTLERDERRRLQTFQQLGDLLENRVPPPVAMRLDRHEELIDRIDFDSQPYRFVVSLREDFLPELERWTDLIPRLGPNRYRLLPMSRAQAFEAVQKTGGALVDESSGRAIVEFLSRQAATGGGRPVREERRIEPALLSLVCASLNADRLSRQPPGPQLDVSNLEMRGAQILDRFYDNAFAELPQDQRASVEEWVEANLITEGGARRPYPLNAVDPALLPSLRRLVDRRLLRIENSEGGDQVELVHDRLAAVALERARTKYERTAEAERLLRQKEAAELEALKQRAAMSVIAEDRARLEKARADDAQRASRRSRWLTAFMAVLAAAALSGLIYARREAHRARTQTQLAESRTKYAEEVVAQTKSTVKALEEALTQTRTAASVAVENTVNQKRARTLLSEADRLYRDAAQDLLQLKTCPGLRIYPHVGREADKAFAQSLTPVLREAGFNVPPVDVVASVIRNTEVRYFRSSEENGARAAVDALQKAGVTDVRLSFVPGFETRRPSGRVITRCGWPARPGDVDASGSSGLAAVDFSD